MMEDEAQIPTILSTIWWWVLKWWNPKLSKGALLGTSACTGTSRIFGEHWNDIIINLLIKFKKDIFFQKQRI